MGYRLYTQNRKMVSIYFICLNIISKRICSYFYGCAHSLTCKYYNFVNKIFFLYIKINNVNYIQF